MDQGEKEKLDQLKEKAADDADIEYVNGLAEKLRKAHAWNKYSIDPITQEVVKYLRETVKELRTKLAMTKGLTLSEIETIHARIDENMKFLHVLTPDTNAVIESINKEIEDGLMP